MPGTQMSGGRVGPPVVVAEPSTAPVVAAPPVPVPAVVAAPPVPVTTPSVPVVEPGLPVGPVGVIPSAAPGASPEHPVARAVRQAKSVAVPAEYRCRVVLIWGECPQTVPLSFDKRHRAATSYEGRNGAEEPHSGQKRSDRPLFVRRQGMRPSTRLCERIHSLVTFQTRSAITHAQRAELGH